MKDERLHLITEPVNEVLRDYVDYIEDCENATELYETIEELVTTLQFTLDEIDAYEPDNDE